MRRIDRDFSDNDNVIEACINNSQVIRLSVNDGEVPYIIPLCFGYERKKDGRRFFYFHKNRNGKLYELIGKNEGICSFELEGESSLFLDDVKMTCNMDYASIIGKGRLSLVEGEEEKIRLLDNLMEHYGHKDFQYNKAAMNVILVYSLEVKELTCKATRGWREKHNCL